MTNTNTHEKAHSYDPVGFKNDSTNTLDSPISTHDGKAFARLAARFALAGHTLTRSNLVAGAGVYYAGRWRFSRALPNLEAAAHFLAQIGGAP